MQCLVRTKRGALSTRLCQVNNANREFALYQRKKSQMVKKISKDLGTAQATLELPVSIECTDPQTGKVI